MSRWSPDSRGRLERAAYDLFLEQGYERTTVADIAKRAGLTERTFFRQYADKREVLFGGGLALQDAMLAALDAAPLVVSTIDAVQLAVEAIAGMMHGRRELARERNAIVAAHADLQERERTKRATLTAELASGLQRRGVVEPQASLAAAMGIAVFFVQFACWLDDPAAREFVELVREGFAELKAVAAGDSVRDARIDSTRDA